jgi:very-short-patch-repair endonuclease
LSGAPKDSGANYLRRKQSYGFGYARPRTAGFRRQHPIGPYVLDFYCAKARLAIEVDGASHDMGDRPEHDKQRDAWLKEHGIVRIPAAEISRSVDEMADAIVRMAANPL